MKSKISNTLKKYEKIAFNFFERQKQFKKSQAEFEEIKTEFYSEMTKLFEAENIEGSISFSDNFVDGNLEVKRIQKSSIIFDAERLEKKLGKEIAKNVIVKKYEVIDMFGFIAYLKECNVDPKVFKSFLSITKSVDVKELERLEEIGKIDAKQLEGCYTIKKQKPYFTVGFKKWHGEND